MTSGRLVISADYIATLAPYKTLLAFHYGQSIVVPASHARAGEAMTDLLQDARWIWSSGEKTNHYVLFARTIPGPVVALKAEISASSYYELYVNGKFVGRGPVYGDPQWVQVDEYDLGTFRGDVQLAIVAHHESGIRLASVMEAPGGFIGRFSANGQTLVTDASWKCLDLLMWRDGVERRGWALGYCEDYDARLEPEGWTDKCFDEAMTENWPNAVLVPDQEHIWANYTARIVPYLKRRMAMPLSFKAWQAPGPSAADIAEVSNTCDTEELVPLNDWAPFSLKAFNETLGTANAFTFDLGKERIGYYAITVQAPAGTIIELSGAELLREGRPWIFRKGTRYSVRYVSHEGPQTFTSFSWNGFRYLHLVIRGQVDQVSIQKIGCLQKMASLTPTYAVHLDDKRLKELFDLCAYTLRMGVQEHLIDCPTREQAQYWGDGVFIAESIRVGFGCDAYLRWYLEAFLHVPLNENGNINCIYPGNHTSLLDYSLIPMIGQQFWKAAYGTYYQARATLEKGLALKKWYDANTNELGLLDFPYEEYAQRGLRNFIDHPGVGWHNFPHPGIERDGVSAPLNAFYYNYCRVLADIAQELDDPIAHDLEKQTRQIGHALVKHLYDGQVFHDTVKDDVLSEGTAWQTNALAVNFGLLTGERARVAMQAMLDGYDKLCRCSPYFHFFFLPALRKAGLQDEALVLIKKEWGQMLDGGATTTWEGFLGDALDSLCHPWSTAPFLYLLRK